MIVKTIDLNVNIGFAALSFYGQSKSKSSNGGVFWSTSSQNTVFTNVMNVDGALHNPKGIIKNL